MKRAANPIQWRSAFPDPHGAAADGLLAGSSSLSTELLLDAYSHGIFPWFDSDDEAVLWWCPDPRAVMDPTALHVSKSLAKRLRSGYYRVTVDCAFADVVSGCAAPRQEQRGTWITPRMQAAYGRLHELGFAHSVEAWRNDELVGGLYGVSLGAMFFGESMFSSRPDASKVALAHLARLLRSWRFRLIDCQIMNEHLRSLGAQAMPRQQFLSLVADNRDVATRCGAWTFDKRVSEGAWRPSPSASAQ